jgi:hypothetical protein
LRHLLRSTIFLLLFSPLHSFAQDPPEVEDEAAIEEYADGVSFLASHPVNLNHAGLDELQLLPGLSPYQVLRLSKYLDENPGISDPFVLAADSVLDRASVEAILPYICFDGQAGKGRSSGNACLRIKRSTPLPQESRKWYDSPWDTREKASYCWKNWEVFGQAQKDAGERSYSDFSSACLQHETPGQSLKVLAGDYSVSIGQGLIMGGTVRPIVSAGWAKSFGTGSNSVKPYHSSDEARALRGAAIQYSMPCNSSLIAWVSYRKLDASLDSLGRTAKIISDGYHRDSAELAHRDMAEEMLAGARLGHNFGSGLNLGISACRVSYSPERCDSLHYSGNAGIDARLTIGDLMASGEAASDSKKRKAGIIGSGFRAGPAESFFQYYSYQQGYSSPRFNALESFGGQDEQGALLGSGVKLPYKTKVDGLYRHFQTGSAGKELLRGEGGYQLEFVAVNGIIKSLELGWRWRQKIKEELDTANGSKLWTNSRFTSYRFCLSWDIQRQTKFYAHYLTGRYRIASLLRPERNELFCLGIKLVPAQGLGLAGQSIIYNCPSYDARLYLSEPEITGSGSFHGYWGTGRRDALVVRYKFRSSISCEAKAAREVREYKGETAKKTEIGLLAVLNY